jgi:hypothetical protein
MVVFLTVCAEEDIWALRGTRQQGSREDYITRGFMVYTAHQMLFGWLKKEE